MQTNITSSQYMNNSDVFCNSVVINQNDPLRNQQALKHFNGLDKGSLAIIFYSKIVADKILKVAPLLGISILTLKYIQIVNFSQILSNYYSSQYRTCFDGKPSVSSKSK